MKANPSKRAAGLAALFFIAVANVSLPAAATEVGGSRTVGLGLAVGTATSFVGKFFLDGHDALDFGVSFWRWRRGCWTDRRGVVYCDSYGDTYRHGGFGLHGDYLWQSNIASRRARLDWHIGAGVRYWSLDDDYYYDDARSVFAGRMPLGLDLTFVRPSFLELYAEVVPLLVVVPRVDPAVEAFIGARLYF